MHQQPSLEAGVPRHTAMQSKDLEQKAMARAVVDEVRDAIEQTEGIGRRVRHLMGGGEPDQEEPPEIDMAWEVAAATRALGAFSSRWTIEILAALYVAGPQRFNQLKHLLEGISSRTLSDKLRWLVEEGHVERRVADGPPVEVRYQLSEVGLRCGRLLSPFVAYLKLQQDLVVAS